MIFSKLFSPCIFGHADPIKAMRGKVFRWACPRCCQDLGAVLPKQKLKIKRTQTPVRVIAIRKQA